MNNTNYAIANIPDFPVEEKPMIEPLSQMMGRANNGIHRDVEQ